MQGFTASNDPSTSTTNSISSDCNPPASDPHKQPTLDLKCKHCQKKYKLIAALKKHEDKCNRTEKPHTQHPKPSDYDDAQPQEKKAENACKECGQTFKYAKTLQRHEAMHQGKTPYWCRLCMENFASYQDKVLHKISKHPNKSKRPKCKLCPGLDLGSEEEYLYHITELHKGKFGDYCMCSFCGKQFKTRSELTHHNNSKCGTIKQYKCKVCEQDLMTAGSLHNHMLRHTGERCSMCGFCGKMFLTPGQLKVHERAHTQDKAFVCNVCGKGFCHRQSLITHSTLHTGVKPYLCDHCGHSFSCVGNLIKHRRTHADTCGSTVLTSHRVGNPLTKMRVKLNTPQNSKLKALRKERELQEKLEAYKKKLVQKSDAPPGPTMEEVGGVQDGEFSMSSHNSNCSYQSGEDDLGVNYQQGADLGYDFNVKTEDELPIDEAPYIPNGFLHTKMLEMVDPLLNSPLKKLDENDFFKHFSDDLQDYPNKTAIKEVKVDLSSVQVKSIFSTTHFLSHINSSPATDHNSSQSNENNDFYDSDNSCDQIKEPKTTRKTKRKKKGRGKTVQEKIPEADLEEFIQLKSLDREAEGSCRYCKKRYTNLGWLAKHERNHEEKTQRELKDIKSTIRYRCSCCKVGFESREECRTHQQNMHADVLTCQDCDKIFSNVDSLRSHQNNFHKGLPRKVYVYVCEKCGLQFRQKAFLTHHENSNCGAGPVFVCHVCGKGFNSVHTRRSHLRIHDPKKRFLCKFCGKSFRWKGQLKIHERSHTGEKPFKCLYCPKAFAYRESLLTHSSMHTGVKPHLCEACGARFSCIGNLIKHRGTHASTCGWWYSKYR